MARGLYHAWPLRDVVCVASINLDTSWINDCGLARFSSFLTNYLLNFDSLQQVIAQKTGSGMPLQQNSNLHHHHEKKFFSKEPWPLICIRTAETRLKIFFGDRSVYRASLVSKLISGSPEPKDHGASTQQLDLQFRLGINNHDWYQSDQDLALKQ